MQAKNTFVALVAVLFFAVCQVSQGVTIYVDAANAGSATMDGSQADPWDTITKGADHLVAVNVAPNQGGHTVQIAEGTYNEVIELSSGHSGEPGATNVFLVDGNVQIGLTWMTGVQHLRWDGFRFEVAPAYHICFR